MNIFVKRNNGDPQEVFKDVGGFRYNNEDGLLLLDENDHELKRFTAEEITRFATFENLLPR